MCAIKTIHCAKEYAFVTGAMGVGNLFLRIYLRIPPDLAIAGVSKFSEWFLRTVRTCFTHTTLESTLSHSLSESMWREATKIQPLHETRQRRIQHSLEYIRHSYKHKQPGYKHTKHSRVYVLTPTHAIYLSIKFCKKRVLMARNGRKETRNYGVKLCSNLCIPTHVRGCVDRIPLDPVVVIVSQALRAEPYPWSGKMSQGVGLSGRGYCVPEHAFVRRMLVSKFKKRH
jgi:hypothetical protein